MSSIPQGLRDDFWDVREAEREEERQVRYRLDAITHELALAKRVLALRANEGFADFEKRIAALRAGVTRSMIAHQGSDSDLRVLQGKAQALSDIMTLMGQSEEAVERLAAQQKQVQNHLDQVLRRRPISRE